MANGLLDYIENFDINKGLGVQYGLPKGMLSPEIESQMNVGGTLGGIGNVIEGIQSGAGVPENIFRFLSGQKTGRQGVANTATQNYLNQLNIAKLQGDIAQDPYKLAKIKFEVDKAPFELGEIQNKFYQSSFKTQGIKKEFKKLEDEGKFEELNTLAANPDEYFKVKQSKDINKLDYTQPELSAARILNLDVRNRKSWNETDELNYNAIISAPSVEEATRLNAEARARSQEDPNRVPYVYTPSRNDVIAQIRKNSKSTNVSQANQQANQQTNVAEPSYAPSDVSNLPIGQFAPTAKYKEGGVKGSDGKIYPTEKFNKLGIEKQNLLLRDVKRSEYVIEEKELFNNIRTDKGSAQYANYNAGRTAQYIEKVLDNPEKFTKLFSTFGGRLPITLNKATGNFIATESAAQDIANLLNTIKGQQFTNEIQLMRANNKTGGAVGNVSDREVSMFQNMAANLDYSGTPEQLWSELNSLYNQGQRMNNMYVDNFRDYYGEEEFNRYKMDKLKLTPKAYNQSLQESLTAQKEGKFKSKVDSVKPNTSYQPSPNAQEVLTKYGVEFQR
jgi:hypothetical protein